MCCLKAACTCSARRRCFEYTLLTSYVFDFVAAYLLGIIFQYFAIVPMLKLSPGLGV